MKKYKWQSEYPPNCPKVKLYFGKLEVFRFVQSNPPIEKDFIPYGKMGKNIGECKAWGISLFETESICRQKQLDFKMFKNMQIAKATIEQADGQIELDNNGHLTLWMYEGVDLHSKFRVI